MRFTYQLSANIYDICRIFIHTDFNLINRDSKGGTKELTARLEKKIDIQIQVEEILNIGT